MPLTPEQFNKLITKEEHRELEIKVDRIDNNIEKIISATDYLVKKMDIIETELTSNLAAHDRFERRINRIETHLGLKQLIS